MAGPYTGRFPLGPLDQPLNRGEIVTEDEKPGDDEDPTWHHGQNQPHNADKQKGKARKKSYGFPKGHLFCSV